MSSPICRRKLPKRKASAAATATDSPATKKLKKNCNRQIQMQAFGELLVLKSCNGGKLKHGDIEQIISKYNKIGWCCVNRSNLEYRMSLHLQGKVMRDETLLTTVIADSNSSANTNISSL
jgi:hypothetical protein